MKRRMLAALALAVSVAAAAQDKYPSRPIQMVVAQTQGTTADIIARAYAEKISRVLGQPVVVQNRPGAGGTIATQAVAASAPDGYTILMTNSAHSINPSLYSNLGFDTLRDFAGVAMVADSPALVVINPQIGARTLKEFIALAKQKPGSLNYGSAGVGSATHLAGAYFASRAGIEIVHVPYKSGAELISDLLGGRIQATFVPPAFLLAQIKEGKVLALGVSQADSLREPLAVPSARQAANVDYEYSTWYGIFAPAKVPAATLELLSRTIAQAGEEQDLKERYRKLGLLSRKMALRDFDAFIKADIEKLAPVIKASGAKAN